METLTVYASIRTVPGMPSICDILREPNNDFGICEVTVPRIGHLLPCGINVTITPSRIQQSSIQHFVTFQIRQREHLAPPKETPEQHQNIYTSFTMQVPILVTTLFATISFAAPTLAPRSAGDICCLVCKRRSIQRDDAGNSELIMQLAIGFLDWTLLFDLH